MATQLSLTDFLKLAETESRIAIHQEIAADRLTPIGIVESLQAEMTEGVVLESGLQQQQTGRYSFVAFGKLATLRATQEGVLQEIGAEQQMLTAHPFDALRDLLNQLKYQSTAKDFLHGAIGYITYDAIRYFEKIPEQHANDAQLPEMLFNFYQTTLLFDHMQQTLCISMLVEPGENPQKTYVATQEKITALIQKINSFAPSAKAVSTQRETYATDEIDIDLSDEAFCQLVEQAKQHIIAGDVFQLVLSRNFQMKYSVTPLAIYRALRRVSPAPYMFYLPIPNGVMIGASPEKLISVRNQHVEIHPIAGTRPRGVDALDATISADLLSDKKELAEHMMLVDLARNDLGAVCEPGSVQVKDLLTVKHFSHVSHITSTVTGKLQHDKDALAAFAAAFPAGTLTGAPKIRAMEIIDSLETSRRGLYGGAICRLDGHGNLDSCIAIRMALLQNGIARVRTGAGIVYDSHPQAEANETRQKANGVLAAIQFAEEEGE